MGFILFLTIFASLVQLHPVARVTHVLAKNIWVNVCLHRCLLIFLYSLETRVDTIIIISYYNLAILTFFIFSLRCTDKLPTCTTTGGKRRLSVDCSVDEVPIPHILYSCTRTEATYVPVRARASCLAHPGQGSRVNYTYVVCTTDLL
jgi:hypothetical protein